MKPTRVRLLCPVCGGEIDEQLNVDIVKSEHPQRELICLNEYLAHYEIEGARQLLAQYNKKRNFEYTVYLGLN